MKIINRWKLWNVFEPSLKELLLCMSVTCECWTDIPNSKSQCTISCKNVPSYMFHSRDYRFLLFTPFIVFSTNQITDKTIWLKFNLTIDRWLLLKKKFTLLFFPWFKINKRMMERFFCHNYYNFHDKNVRNTIFNYKKMYRHLLSSKAVSNTLIFIIDWKDWWLGNFETSFIKIPKNDKNKGPNEYLLVLLSAVK